MKEEDVFKNFNAFFLKKKHRITDVNALVLKTIVPNINSVVRRKVNLFLNFEEALKAQFIHIKKLYVYNMHMLSQVGLIFFTGKIIHYIE